MNQDPLRSIAHPYHHLANSREAFYDRLESFRKSSSVRDDERTPLFRLTRLRAIFNNC